MSAHTDLLKYLFKTCTAYNLKNGSVSWFYDYEPVTPADVILTTLRNKILQTQCWYAPTFSIGSTRDGGIEFDGEITYTPADSKYLGQLLEIMYFIKNNPCAEMTIADAMQFTGEFSNIEIKEREETNMKSNASVEEVVRIKLGSNTWIFNPESADYVQVSEVLERCSEAVDAITGQINRIVDTANSANVNEPSNVLDRLTNQLAVYSEIYEVVGTFTLSE